MAARKSVNTRPQGAWSIKGRGKSAQYRVAFKAGTLNKGDAFQVTNKQGITRTGVTTDLVESTDGLDYWTVQLDKQSPEERAHAQAVKAQAQAQYWASDKGLETAQRMQERADRKAQGATAQVETAQPQVPQTAQVETAQPQPQPQGFDPQVIAQVIAGLIAQGIDHQVAAQTALALSGTAQPQPQVPQPQPQVPQVKARKPRTSKAQQVPQAQQAGSCVACGKSAPTLSFHKGAQVDGVCDTCMSADGDTIRQRAIRRGLVKSS